MTRDFIAEDVPDDEVRGEVISKAGFLACLRATFLSSAAAKFGSLPYLWLAIENIIQYSNSWIRF